LAKELTAKQTNKNRINNYTYDVTIISGILHFYKNKVIESLGVTADLCPERQPSLLAKVFVLVR